MTIERVRLTRDRLDPVDEPLGLGGRRNALGDASIGFDRAELRRQIFGPPDPFARHPWIEEVRPPAHAERNVGSKRHRFFEATLADEAPWTDDVGDDVDRHGGASIGQ